MIGQYKNPILVSYASLTTLSDVETALNDALSGNSGYCFVDIIRPSGDGGESYFIIDEDWSVENPIHSVVFVEVTEEMDTQLPSVLSGNPGYRLVYILHCGGTYGFILGQS